MSDRNQAGRATVLVGKVVKPHGIRGELCVESYADSPDLFFGLKAVLLGPPERRPASYRIRAAREHKGRLLLTLQGVDDRNRAESLRGLEVRIPKDALPELEDGEFYMDDLLGLRVLLPDGNELGVLERFLETPGQITWVIAHASGREVLLPAVNEFLMELDLDNGIIRVEPPEGLVELYLSQPEPVASGGAAGPDRRNAPEEGRTDLPRKNRRSRPGPRRRK
jgi:16S rRNA processing protein RimM